MKLNTNKVTEFRSASFSGRGNRIKPLALGHSEREKASRRRIRLDRHCSNKPF